jgi:hypothetical protein
LAIAAAARSGAASWVALGMSMLSGVIVAILLIFIPFAIHFVFPIAFSVLGILATIIPLMSSIMNPARVFKVFLDGFCIELAGLTCSSMMSLILCFKCEFANLKSFSQTDGIFGVITLLIKSSLVNARTLGFIQGK